MIQREGESLREAVNNIQAFHHTTNIKPRKYANFKKEKNVQMG